MKRSIQEVRILPPLAIGRLGSASEPLDNYVLADDPEHPLDFRQIQRAETLVVDPVTGEVSKKPGAANAAISFKDENERIRPVAPFLEVFAVMNDGRSEPLTLDLMHNLAEPLSPEDIEWRVTVANRKVSRRTGNPHDCVQADTGWFSSHNIQPLKGYCRNFVDDSAFLPFGCVRFIKPSQAFPEIRLRFTPAKGLIYGPKLDAPPSNLPLDPTLYIVPANQQIYDPKSGWLDYELYPGLAQEAMAYEGDDEARLQLANELKRRREGKPPSKKLTKKLADEVDRLLAERLTQDEELDRDRRVARETLPPALFAIHPPAPPWLHDNVAVSRGYLDDACDGIVEVRIKRKSQPPLLAMARICSAPPAVVPDTLFLRNLADDLEQVIHGPRVPTNEPPDETRRRALDIVRRAFETVRFLNVTVGNGNPVMGRNPLDIDTMPAEEAFGTLRLMRPVFSEKSVDTLAVLALHKQVYAALQAGATPWFGRLLRQPRQAADFTDYGRRKMPAMMCGADGNYLALTYRQINTIFAASGLLNESPAAKDSPTGVEIVPDPKGLKPRNNAAQLHSDVHYVPKGNPLCTTPVTAVANCTPGLEVDFRAVWRRLFEGIVLREWDNLVIGVDGKAANRLNLEGHRLLRVNEVPMMTQMLGPSPENPATRSVVLSTERNPHGIAPLEWSNALASVLREFEGKMVRCDFTSKPVWDERQPWSDEPGTFIQLDLKVRSFFDGETAVISKELVEPGELTQGLCSPWQNDYRECSCYYWASARPDYVNVEPSPSGGSVGDNWLQHERTGDYVADDYADSRLIGYDDLFREWERLLRFQIRGRDASPGQSKL